MNHLQSYAHSLQTLSLSPAFCRSLQPNFPYFADSAQTFPQSAWGSAVTSRLIRLFTHFYCLPIRQHRSNSITLAHTIACSLALAGSARNSITTTLTNCCPSNGTHTHTHIQSHSTGTYSPAVQCNCAGMRASETAIVCGAHLTKGDDNSSSN